MSEEIRLSLIESLDIAKWPWLTQHKDRGTLFILSNGENIVEVAYKIAIDDAEFIKNLMNADKLKKPTDPQIEEWENAPNKDFQFIIVQPYVLIQEHLETKH